MTILFMTRKFPPAKGGMENYAFDLYTSLNKTADIKLVKWGRSSSRLTMVLFVVPYICVKSFFVLLSGGVDVVHSQDGVLAPVGLFLSKLFGKHYSVVIHGLDTTYKNKIFQTINLWAIKKAEVVFCISQAAADETIKRGVDASKTMVIPLGITDDKFMDRTKARKQLEKEVGLKSDAAVLLTVGRLVERKGVAWFVENVMPMLIKKYPNVIYLIVGGGENEAKIKTLISSNKLENHVKMLGKVPDEALPMLYNGADVFVQPNIVVPGDMEGFGRILLEASLCELPVVAAGIEGIKDAIKDGKNGRLVESEDVDAFIKQIGAFISDNKTARKFGTVSREYSMEHYSWDNIVQDYLKGFERITKTDK